CRTLTMMIPSITSPRLRKNAAPSAPSSGRPMEPASRELLLIRPARPTALASTWTFGSASIIAPCQRCLQHSNNDDRALSNALCSTPPVTPAF
ncbi:cytochrome c reductase (Complex III) hinge protein, partial [Chondrus crispus]